MISDSESANSGRRQTRQSTAGQSSQNSQADMSHPPAEQVQMGQLAQAIGGLQEINTIKEASEISQKAINSMELAQKVMEDCKSKFCAEAATMRQTIDSASAEITAALGSMKVYDNRLTDLEKKCEKIQNLEEDVEGLKQTVDRLKSERGDIEQLALDTRNKLKQYIERPTKFAYERTIICQNVEMLDGEDDEIRTQIAYKILEEGMKMTPPPLIVATSRLPFNPMTRTPDYHPGLRTPDYHPGLKIEFASNEIQRIAMANAKNLRHSTLNGIMIRPSMSHRDRMSIMNQQALTRVLEEAGIPNIPQIMPSGSMRRQNGGFGRGGYGRYQGARSAAATAAPTQPDGHLYPSSVSAWRGHGTTWRPQGRRATNVLGTTRPPITPITPIMTTATPSIPTTTTSS